MDELTHLLTAAAGGDRDALDEFLALAQPDVWRFCAVMVGAVEADDAVQETFVRAWRSARGFRGDASAKTWLLAIAQRVCYELYRRRSRRDVTMVRLRAPVVVGDPAELVALTDLVGRLAPDRRSAFVLTQLLGLTYEQAAAVSDCPVGTIRSRVARARLELFHAHDASDSGAMDIPPGR